MNSHPHPHEAHWADPTTLLEHRGWLQRFVRRLAHDEGSADDLVQETWLVAARRGMRGVREPRSFLAGVARRLALRRSHDEQRRAEREAIAARPEAFDSRVLDESLQVQRAALDALAQLPDEPRSWILAHYVDGKSYAQLADELGIPSGTLRSGVQRGLTRVRERLDRRFGERSAWTVLCLDGPRATPPVVDARPTNARVHTPETLHQLGAPAAASASTPLMIGVLVSGMTAKVCLPTVVVLGAAWLALRPNPDPPLRGGSPTREHLAPSPSVAGADPARRRGDNQRGRLERAGKRPDNERRTRH